MRAGEILRKHRKERGFSQAEIAAYYGVATTTYLRWESGKSKVSFDDFTGIMVDIFKVPLDDIFNKYCPCMSSIYNIVKLAEAA